MPRYKIKNDGHRGKAFAGKDRIHVVAAGKSGEVDMAVALTDDQIENLAQDRCKVEAVGDAKLPGLTGKSKADLLKIAKDENVPDVSESMTIADIASAIELHREG